MGGWTAGGTPAYARARMAIGTAGVVQPEEVPITRASPAVDAPYAPSWLDRLIAWIEARPGPTALAYAALAVIGVGLSLAIAATIGTLDAAELAAMGSWGLFLPLTVWAVHHLALVAGSSFDAFEPLLGDSVGPEDRARLRYELTVIPARPALGLLAFSAVFTPIYWVIDPEGSAITGMPPFALGLRFMSEVFFGALVLIFLWQSLRQLAGVTRIHRRATLVDLFRPAPLYAFSQLTARAAILLAFAFIVPSAVAAFQAQGAGADALFIGYASVGVIAAAVVFVVPLLGMQRRIAAEKHRLQAEVGIRIESTIEAIHGAIDRRDLVDAGAMQGALGVLVTERDLVDRLPTLPWRPGTLGAVITAIVVPLGLSIASRLLERAL